MVIRMGVAEAKARLSEALRRVSAGDSIIIERRGKPLAVIRSWSPEEERPREHWSRRLHGLAAELPGFSEIMQEVVDSREGTPARRVDLDEP